MNYIKIFGGILIIAAQCNALQCMDKQIIQYNQEAEQLGLYDSYTHNKLPKNNQPSQMINRYVKDRYLSSSCFFGVSVLNGNGEKFFIENLLIKDFPKIFNNQEKYYDKESKQLNLLLTDEHKKKYGKYLERFLILTNFLNQPNKKSKKEIIEDYLLCDREKFLSYSERMLDIACAYEELAEIFGYEAHNFKNIISDILYKNRYSKGFFCLSNLFCDDQEKNEEITKNYFQAYKEESLPAQQKRIKNYKKMANDEYGKNLDAIFDQMLSEIRKEQLIACFLHLKNL